MTTTDDTAATYRIVRFRQGTVLKPREETAS